MIDALVHWRQPTDCLRENLAFSRLKLVPNITGAFGNLPARGDEGMNGHMGTGRGAFFTRPDASYSLGAISYVPNSALKQVGNVLDGIGFDASKASSLYGKSATIQPPAMLSLYLIKF